MRPTVDELKLLALRLRVLMEEVMQVAETVIRRQGIVLRGTFLRPTEDAFSWMKERLGHLGLVPMLSRRGDVYEVRVTHQVQEHRSNPLINLILFLLTVASTLLVGAEMEGVNIILHPEKFTAGIPFACTILAILVAHEFGHYFLSMFHGVSATLPYFIPAPTIIGTLGAVIKTKSYIPNRKSLLDIGAAGPLCGFVVALVALCMGLYYSEIVDIEPLVKGGGVQEFGDSLAVYGITYLLKGPLAEGKAVMFNPIAFAGWVGLLITAFNLMPVGQLDGGHILYAVVGHWHTIVAKVTIAALIVMGWFFWEGWYVWAFITLLLGPSHAPPLDDVTPLNRGRKCIALVALGVFALCFVPVPITLRDVF
ncbi:MAG: site-2 protease family protein [Candidatus Aureabacteria bacterium]|nr:site-2 protease family protein [Candidatus Auribacterota bacterium]